MDHIAGRFARVEARLRTRHLVLGLLADLPRKNCWTIAEWAGEATPNAMQHLLSRAKWDADAVHDDLRAYVVEHLHDDQALLLVDETGDVKKGSHTDGVQRQYSGTAGRIENSQVAVYLAWADRRGHAALDLELVPRSWTDQPDRCQAAGLDPDTAFATKSELAARMITRFLHSGHHAPWAAGDEVYGCNPTLRAALEKRAIGYVLAVARPHEVTTGAGKFRADILAEKLPKRAWQKLSRRSPRSRGRSRASLVPLEAPSSSPFPGQPLQTPSRNPSMIVIHSWGTWGRVAGPEAAALEAVARLGVLRLCTSPRAARPGRATGSGVGCLPVFHRIGLTEWPWHHVCPSSPSSAAVPASFAS